MRKSYRSTSIYAPLLTTRKNSFDSASTHSVELGTSVIGSNSLSSSVLMPTHLQLNQSKNAPFLLQNATIYYSHNRPSCIPSRPDAHAMPFVPHQNPMPILLKLRHRIITNPGQTPHTAPPLLLQQSRTFETPPAYAPLRHRFSSSQPPMIDYTASTYAHHLSANSSSFFIK